MAPKPWPASTLVPRPAVKVNGTEDGSFSQNLLSLRVVYENTGVQRCEAAFNDWGNPQGTPGYLFSASGDFEVGNSFEVRVDDNLLFAGAITCLAQKLIQGSPPILSVKAEFTPLDLAKPAGPRLRPRRCLWALNLFQHAKEWEFSNDPGGSPAKNPAAPSCTGAAGRILAEFNPGLQVRDDLQLATLSPKFLGVYTVTRITQLWDHQSGPWTDIAAERR